MAQVRIRGYYQSPEFSTPMIQRAIDGLGGWRAFCAGDNLVADRAHFLKIYEQLLNRRQEEVARLPQVARVIDELAQGKREALTDGR